MPITNATVVPVIVAARLVARYQQERVYSERTNRAWQSALANGGDTVRLSEIAAGTIGDYTAGATITYGDADAVHLGDLTIDKKKYFAVKFDDLNQVMASPDIIDPAVEEHAVELALQVDADVKAAMIAGATTGPSVTLDHSTASPTANEFKIAQMQRQMRLARMPRAGRWCIIGPFTAELMQAYALRNDIIRSQYVVASGLPNGDIGDFGGVRFYVSELAVGKRYAESAYANTNTPLTPNDAGYDTPGSVEEEWIWGNDTATPYLEQVREVESMRLQTTFANAVRGLQTYGARVLFPKRIYKSAVTIANIPA